MKQERILIIAKDDHLASQMGETLRKAGYRIWRARSGVEGLKKLNRASPDLVIMQRELLPVKRQDPLSHIRQASYVPIITVGSDQDPTDMLEFGADVYMLTPPNLRELTARVRALLRRKHLEEPPLGNLKVGNGETLDGTNQALSQERVGSGWKDFRRLFTKKLVM